MNCERQTADRVIGRKGIVDPKRSGTAYITPLCHGTEAFLLEGDRCENKIANGIAVF